MSVIDKVVDLCIKNNWKMVHVTGEADFQPTQRTLEIINASNFTNDIIKCCLGTSNQYEMINERVADDLDLLCAFQGVDKTNQEISASIIKCMAGIYNGMEWGVIFEK